MVFLGEAALVPGDGGGVDHGKRGGPGGSAGLQRRAARRPGNLKYV